MGIIQVQERSPVELREEFSHVLFTVMFVNWNRWNKQDLTTLRGIPLMQVTCSNLWNRKWWLTVSEEEKTKLQKDETNSHQFSAVHSKSWVKSSNKLLWRRYSNICSSTAFREKKGMLRGVHRAMSNTDEQKACYCAHHEKSEAVISPARTVSSFMT